MLKHIASKIYEWGHRAHKELYRSGLLTSIKLPIKTVSVGNLAMGGSGKTPIVIKIARTLSERSKAVILSRGYKGRASSRGGVVSDGSRVFLEAEDCGDEPLMMASHLPHVPIFIGKKRWRSGVYAEVFQPEVFILDDGFQHERLHSDVHIVVIPSHDPLGGRFYFPKGRLRDHPGELRRADFIILMHSSSIKNFHKDEILKEISAWNSSTFIYEAELKPASLVKRGEKCSTIDTLKGKKVFAFCGIGNPHRFIHTLQSCEANIVGHSFFPDHHFYTSFDLKKLQRLAKNHEDSMLITTEKDAARLPKHGFNFYYLKVDVQFLEGEKEFFDNLFQKLSLPSYRKLSC